VPDEIFPQIFFTISAASLTLSTILLVLILFYIGIPILDMIE